MNNIAEKIINLEKEVSDERRRLSTDRMDISFGELINLYKNKELIIRPEYQRLFRWTLEQKTALIESILLSIPIPPIFVSEDKDGLWELVDGLQRVSTFISFFGELDTNVTDFQYIVNSTDESDESEVLDEDIETEDNVENENSVNIHNKWELQKGGLLKSLEGFNIDTIPNSLKINLKRAVCRVEILRGESNVSMKYELFKRLNSGGSKLTPQEIRNAIYRGTNPKLNELTLELSQHPLFLKLTALSLMKKQELYDQELVLRFIAFYDNINNVNENTENFLNNFMEDYVSGKEIDLNFYKSLFIETLSLIDNLGNDKIFRNGRNLFVPAEFEGITVSIAQNIEKYRNNDELLLQRIDQLKNDADFRRFSGSASNSKSRIRTRLLRANEIFSS